MAVVTTASNDAQGIADVVQKISYPSPFFDIARKYLPLNIKEMFTWTQYFYAISSVIHPIVNKMSEYPVTDLVYGNIDASAKKAWEKILEQTIDVKSLLIEMHTDYYVYGNAFLQFHEPFIRYLICERCQTRKQARSMKYRFIQQSNTWHFEGKCTQCGSMNVRFKVEDILVRDRTRVRVTKISPMNIEIEHNEFNGETEYIYKLPQGLRKSIMASTKIVIDNTDRIVFDAMVAGKDVRLTRDKIYHFKRPTISGLWRGWGTPPLLPVLKDVHYYYILRKANEALALQRIVPLSILYPSQQGDVSPFQHLNLSSWRGKVEDELGKWRRDPNYVPIMPIPLGYQTLFSEAKQLLVTNEQELCARQIAAGIGVPIEFIMGGLSWSGSSVSLRILENSFVRLRNQDLQCLNRWLVPKLARVYHIPKIELSFTKFKMADDVQAKAQAYNLMQAGFISRKAVLEQDGYDSDDEIAQMEREHIKLNSVKNADAIADQEIKNILQIMANRNAILAQYDGNILQGELQKNIQSLNKDELRVKLGEVAEQYALRLLSQERDLAMQTLERMKTDMPNLHALVIQKMRGMIPQPPKQNTTAPIEKAPMPVPVVEQQPIPDVNPSIGEGGNIKMEDPLGENGTPRRATGGV